MKGKCAFTSCCATSPSAKGYAPGPQSNDNGNSSGKSKGKCIMAQYSMTSAKVQRSAGQSAVAHAAYITGQSLMDQRTGQVADYTERSGVEYAPDEIVLPAKERETQSAQIDRSALWNMAEAAERRKDGNPARKVLVALPHELGPVDRRLLAGEYAQWLADRFGVAVDFAVHRPDKEGDQKNYHAHLVMTTRKIEAGALGEKATLEWDGKRLKEAKLPGAKEQLVEMREAWAQIHNRRMQERYPQVEPISAKSLREQCGAALESAKEHRAAGREDAAREAELKAIELDRTPQQHVGWKATAIERQQRGQDKPLPEMAHRRKLAQQEHASLRQTVAAIREQIVRTAQVLREGLGAFGSRFQQWQQDRTERAQEQKREIERQREEPQRQRGPRRGGRGDSGMEMGG